ncbi:e3 ubiquitin-protein ligase rnf181 [Lasius niger]|uniref:E3 ubiquitin-protein ligase rnf181 n=1 Tax=Lasius niger TaxID=67767 RepID=A0A0J7JTI0_LASNI|nr:e3 ubiquitin-protein ligase rnf181 [Lasius niger]
MDCCRICLMPYRDEECNLIPPCMHLFHHRCIMEWMRYGDTCPLCRMLIARDGKPRKEYRQLMERIHAILELRYDLRHMVAPTRNRRRLLIEERRRRYPCIIPHLI